VPFTLSVYGPYYIFQPKCLPISSQLPVPDSQSGDFSDVIARTPHGEIPWPHVSRLSDEEMKLVVRDAVNKTYRFLCRLFDEGTGGELILRLDERDLVPQWDDPDPI
jgi:hypothetical protein